MAVYETPSEPNPDGLRTDENSRGDRSQVKLGRYEIVRELGKGAMGIVYLAKDPLIGRLVALKTIRPAAHGDDDETKEFQQRFIREAQAAGILNHPNIVTVFDIGQDEASGVNFIAMEYVEGQNLKEVLAQGRPFNFEQIGDIVGQVADALDFAHAKGIVHRDVKPANIILLDGTRAKIMDFGIAKIASGSVNLTTTGQFLGTPNYMAPEQIKGAAVDGRTDIFALGICLYECLTRRKPFGGDSLTSISYKIVHEPFPPLHEINPQIPEGFEEVVGTCLAKEPGKRYQRARDLASALRSVARGEKPAPVEPMQSEATMVTKDRDRLPTIEVPFPDAVDAVEANAALMTNPKAGAAAAASVASGAAAARARPERPAIARQIHRTLVNVRAMPVWKRRIHPVLFIGIAAVLAIALLAAVINIRNKFVPLRPVDVKAEAQRAHERDLRNQANEFVRQGKANEAYAKFQELSKVAPHSPAVAAILQKLSAIRTQEETSRQQFALAKQRFDEGMALFNQKRYAESIPLFEESFHLNANSDETASYLKLAQHALEIADQERASKAGTRVAVATPAPPPTRTPSGTRQPATADSPRTTTSAAPGQLTVAFNNSAVADGYILVKVGSQVITHENLWEETGRFFKRKNARSVSVTKDVVPANTDLEVWVVIPSLSIQEHKVIKQNFLPGVAHKLTVSFDVPSKKFDYQFN